MSQRNWLFLFLVFLLTTLAIYLLQILNVNFLSGDDWEYFNGLSYVVKSLVLGYHTAPIHNPWVCGGLDILTNPQNRIFSPFFLSDLLFFPPLSNLIPLIILTILGLWGSFLLLKELEVSTLFATTGAILFVNSSWFGLHFAQGHMTFGSMQLLPFVAYLALRMQVSVRNLFYLCMIFCYFLLDGAMYTLFFALCLLCTIFILRFDALSRIAHNLLKNKVYVLLCIVTFALLSAPKTLPLLAHKPGVISYSGGMDNRVTMPWSLMPTAFFDVTQTNKSDGHIMAPFDFHEFGTYLSPLAILLILSVLILRLDVFRRNWRYFLSGLFWLWIATGTLPSLNPWHFVDYLPLFNRLHLPSRTLVIVFLFFVILIVKSLEVLHRKFPRLTYVLAGILLIESFYVRIHSGFSPGKELSFPGLIQHTSIDRTVPYVRKPEHYFQRNTGSAKCYEPSFWPSNIIPSGSSDYRTEVYSVAPNNAFAVNLDAYTPGYIKLHYTRKEPKGRIRLNTNALYGWKIEAGNATLYGKGTQNLDIDPHRDSGELILKYDPWYWHWSILAFCIGLIAMFEIIFGRKKRYEDSPGPSSGFNYSAFPPGYYHDILTVGHPVRRAWHNQKFRKVVSILPKGQGMSILDIGCFAGSFLSFLDPKQFTRQVGVDILHKQIDYAREHLGTAFREFDYIPSLADIDFKGEKFDCITLIEVIEHLEAKDVHEVMIKAINLLKPGGKLIITTPNYTSLWPFIEIVINSISEVSYEEQHITKFNFFNFIPKIKRIVPEFETKFHFDSRNTGLFISPFLAAISMKFAEFIFTKFGSRASHFPFGNLLFFSFTRTDDLSQSMAQEALKKSTSTKGAA